ncbi:hypothetical protein BIU99_09925 [Plantibacter sp. MMLR14_011]|nr:hypothetical protein BIU99_09925 [Plantibacter sp. MMLR14_011]
MDRGYDVDLASMRNPAMPPSQLAAIAARRHDLHPLILRHPACYPQLREWIFHASPAQRAMTGAAPVALPPLTQDPRRGRGGLCAILGCGGLALLGVFVIVIAFVGGLLAAPSTPNGPAAEGTTAREDSLAAFESERTAYNELYTQIESNPVAPLVADLLAFRRAEANIADPSLTDGSVAKYAADAAGVREQLEQRIAEAATRLTNVSGSVTEAIVDEAGQGFIDIAWDASTACATSRRADEGYTTIGCVSEEPLAVHLAPEDQIGGDIARRQVVLHELSHLYTRADSDAKGMAPSASSVLVEQGHFQGNSEAFADCYALTYLNLWTLTFDGRNYGYGYVCTAEERELMRSWAAEVHAPMP